MKKPKLLKERCSRECQGLSIKLPVVTRLCQGLEFDCRLALPERLLDRLSQRTVTNIPQPRNMQAKSSGDASSVGDMAPDNFDETEHQDVAVLEAPKCLLLIRLVRRLAPDNNRAQNIRAGAEMGSHRTFWMAVPRTDAIYMSFSSDRSIWKPVWNLGQVPRTEWPTSVRS